MKTRENKVGRAFANLAGKNLLIAAAFALVGGGTASADTVGYWRFENGAFTTDSSGNNYGLTADGTVTAVATGVSSTPGEFFPNPVRLGNLANGSAASLVNASNVRQGHLVTDKSAAFAPNNFTIEAFVSLSTDTTANGNGNAIASHWDTANRAWGLMVADANGSIATSHDPALNLEPFKAQELGFVFTTVNTWGTRKILGSGFTLTTGKDYYVAASYTRPSAQGTADGSVKFWFQDLTAGGPLQSSTVPTSDVMMTPNAETAFQAGTLNKSDDLRFGGVIDEVRLSDEVLGSSQLLLAATEGTVILIL